MKYVVILGDGMADYPLPELGGKTPLEVAVKPNADRLSKEGELGMFQTVPKGLKPGSDVANLSVMGYPPERYYTGRSPLEALSMGVCLGKDDVAVRCNLVTLSDAERFEDKIMLDYSAGEISTAEARALVESVEKSLGTENLRFYGGVSYRHCLVHKGGSVNNDLTPPHDISDRVIGDYLPKGKDGALYRALIEQSAEILKNHPVNLARIEKGLRPATHIWLWGAGTKPSLPSFSERFGLIGAVISAVDLLKGIAVAADMRVIEVEGATGTLTTNFKGKAEAALNALNNGADYVYVHMEAPDECGHQGDVSGKIAAIEKVDWVLGLIENGLRQTGEAYTILITPDHATPLKLKTHVSDPVPYVLYRSDAPARSGKTYTEKNAATTGVSLPSGEALMKRVLKKESAV